MLRSLKKQLNNNFGTELETEIETEFQALGNEYKVWSVVWVKDDDDNSDN